MTKRATIAMMVIFTISFISACVEMACPEPSMYYLRDITTHPVDRMNAIGLGQNELMQADTLKNQLVFETMTHVEFAMNNTKIAPFGLMNTAYGCNDFNLLNPVISSESGLYTNRPIYLRGAVFHQITDSIPAYTNLLKEEKIRALITFPSQLLLTEQAITSIDIHQHAVFESGDYEFYFEWNTSDHEQLTDTVHVFLQF